jgi:SAM-dependent methyltransferase
MLFDSVPSDIDRVFLIQRQKAPGFWNRFESPPDFNGKRVLDLGCGYGALAFDMLDRGAAHCTGIDLSEERVEQARQFARLTGHDDRAAFESGDIRDYAGRDFDIIVSKDTFEHIDDLTGLMDAIVSRLKPGGCFHVGFGPLYHSPFGDHGWYSRMPWGHVAAGRDAVVKRINAREKASFSTIQEAGLNGLTPADFRRHLRHPGTRLLSLTVNSVEGTAKKMAIGPMNVLRQVPGLEPYFTVSMYAVLQRLPEGEALH